MKTKTLMALGYAFIVVVVLAMMNYAMELVLAGAYYSLAYHTLILAALTLAYLTGRMSKHN